MPTPDSNVTDRDRAVIALCLAMDGAPAAALRAATRLLVAIAPEKRRRSLIALPSHSDFYGGVWKNCPCRLCCDSNPSAETIAAANA